MITLDCILRLHILGFIQDNCFSNSRSPTSKFFFLFCCYYIYSKKIYLQLLLLNDHFDLQKYQELTKMHVQVRRFISLQYLLTFFGVENHILGKNSNKMRNKRSIVFN